MVPQKPGNSPGPRQEVVEKQRADKEQAEPRVRRWTVKNEMRGVLSPYTDISSPNIYSLDC